MHGKIGDTQLPLRQGLVQRRQIVAQHRVQIMVFYRDSGAHLVAGKMCAHLNRAERIRLHGNVHFRLA